MSVKPAKRAQKDDRIVDPNMTPLIDVSLVLVVILMVATPMAFQSGIAVNAASKGGRAAEAPAKVERIELNVLADGRVRVNRIVVVRDSLGAALQPLIAASPSGTVVVHCDETVPHGFFVGVLDEVRAQGATNIAVVGS